MQDFTDKLVVITGAAGGVGRSLAIAMAEAGARVLAADIDEVGLEETKAALDAIGAISYIRTWSYKRSHRNSNSSHGFNSNGRY